MSPTGCYMVSWMTLQSPCNVCTTILWWSSHDPPTFYNPSANNVPTLHQHPKTTTDYVPTSTNHPRTFRRHKLTANMRALYRFSHACKCKLAGKNWRQMNRRLNARTEKLIHFPRRTVTINMPPKKDANKGRTPRIRAFKTVPKMPAKQEDDDDEDDGEDPLEDQQDSKPKRVILTANAAASRECVKKKQELAQSAVGSSTDNTAEPATSSAKKTKAPAKTQEPPTPSETSDDLKPVRKKSKTTKDKQKPSTSGVPKPQPTKSKTSKVKMPKSSKPPPPPALTKKTKGQQVQLSKSGKSVTSKRTVGNQPSHHDADSETPAPEEEPDYFASSDEDPRDAQIEMDEAMARALAEDADDSPLELDWSRRKWTPTEDEAIIEHVKSNEIYYNMRRTDFKERTTKDDMWRPLEKRFKVPGKIPFL